MKRPARTTRTRARRYAYRFGAVFLILGAGLALFEGAVRLWTDQKSSRFVYHERLGWHLLPDNAFPFVTRTSDTTVRSNRHGFRDINHEPGRTPGVRRIMFIGDSFTEARQVDLDRSFVKLVGGMLDGQVESLNMGLSGFGTAQELEVLRMYGPVYRPDDVFLMFLHGNDIRNNSSELEPDRIRPFYRIGTDGDLEVTYPRLPEPGSMKRILGSFRSFYFIRDRLEVFNRVHAAGNLLDNLMGATAEDLEGSDRVPHQYHVEPPEEFRRAEDLTRRLILEIADECRRLECRLHVALLPQSLDLDRWGRPSDDPRYDYSRPFDMVLALGDSHGLNVIDLRPELATDRGKHLELYIPGDGHLSVKGHQLVAKALVRHLDGR